MSWRTMGCYVWRTRKPHAVLGLGLRFLVPLAVVLAWAGWMVGQEGWWIAFLLPLFSGRHNAYVGQTGSRYFRDNQHLYGDSRYGAAGKAWADLDPKVYPLPCLFPRSRWWREVCEKAWILLLLPVYNTEWNSKNPRRIKPIKAQQQRWARNSNSVKKWAPRAARVGLYAVLTVAAIYSGWEKWF